MIYRTTLKSVHPPIATDGKRLQFIGNYPCKIGDSVWTDGNVIFGHIPIRSTPFVPIIDDEGVPVLCDGVEGYFAFRGYFDLKGKFHEKKLAVESYFVNDADKFYNIPLTSADYYDAEISVDEDDKPDGYRYATLSEKILTVYKNGEAEQEMNFEELFKTDSISIFSLSIDKNGDWYAVVSVRTVHNHSSEWIKPIRIYTHPGYPYVAEGYLENGIHSETTHSEYETYLLKNGNIEKTLLHYVRDYYDYEDGGRQNAVFTFEPIGGYYILQDYIWSREPSSSKNDNINYNILIDSLTLPAQNGYQIRYTEKHEDFQPFYTNKFDVLDKDDKFIFSVDFSSYLSNSDNLDLGKVYIVKLDGDKFLIGFSLNDDDETILAIYSKKDGLNPVGVGLKNLRLRKMKISKMGG